MDNIIAVSGMPIDPQVHVQMTREWLPEFIQEDSDGAI